MGHLSKSQSDFLEIFNIFIWILTNGFLLYLYFNIHNMVAKDIKYQIIRVKLRHTSTLDAFLGAKDLVALAPRIPTPLEMYLYEKT